MAFTPVAALECIGIAVIYSAVAGVAAFQVRWIRSNHGAG